VVIITLGSVVLTWVKENTSSFVGELRPISQFYGGQPRDDVFLFRISREGLPDWSVSRTFVPSTTSCRSATPEAALWIRSLLWDGYATKRYREDQRLLSYCTRNTSSLLKALDLGPSFSSLIQSLPGKFPLQPTSDSP